MQGLTTASESQPPMGETLVRILKGSVAAGASDVHMRAGHAPIVRLEGVLRPLEHPPLTGDFIEGARDLLARHAGYDDDRLSRRQGDFAVEVEGVGHRACAAHKLQLNNNSIHYNPPKNSR